MPGPGPSRSIGTIIAAAMPLLALVLVAVPAPAQALSGEQTLEIHDAFVITYENISGSDVIWWDWRVTGTVVKMTFWIILSDPETRTLVDDDERITIHEEFTSQSRGHIRLRDGYHTATVKWSCHALRFVTFRYHVMLNPPDLAAYYSMAGLILLAPVVVIGAYLVRERRKKAGPVSGPASK